MNKIILYNRGGSINKEYELNETNLKCTQGMITKCHLKDGTEKIRFSDPTKIKTSSLEEWNDEVKETINLWTWKNIDEINHKLIGNDASMYDMNIEEIKIDDIKMIESIMHSNPRWGGRITNKFEFHK